MSLLKLPKNAVSSVSYKLNAPNVFTLKEYDGIPFVLDSPSFEFAKSTWYFRFKSREIDATEKGDRNKKFVVLLVRSNFETRKQIIFHQIILLDAHHEECFEYGSSNTFEEDDNENFMSYIRSKNCSYDRPCTLTLIIHLFLIQSTEAEFNQASVTRDRGNMFSNESLRDAFRDILLRGDDHNLIFNVQGETVQADKDIICVRSDVFCSMSNHKHNSGVIDIPDCDAQTFKEFLCYLYTGKTWTIDESIMLGLYDLAMIHDLDHLKDECREFIQESLSLANVCKTLELATKHCDENLIQLAVSYILNNWDYILPTVQWQSFMKENSTVADEIFIKSRKEDLKLSMTEKTSRKISLSELPKKAISSVNYTLKMPNFFTLSEYDGVFYDLNSSSFEIPNGICCFRFESEVDVSSEDGEKEFNVFMVHLTSKITQQRIFFELALLDNNDKVYDKRNGATCASANCQENYVTFFNNNKPSYDRRQTLSLIIHLYCIEESEDVNVYHTQLTMEKGKVFCSLHTSLSREFKDLLVNGQDQNLTINVRNEKFPPHQDILQVRSGVFRSMLSHDMQEKVSGVINVPDCGPQACEQLLYYIFTENMERSDQTIMFDLYYAADKYNHPHLKKHCGEFIKKYMSVTNACNVIQLASTHSDESLLDNATSYFHNNIDHILRTEEWLLFMKEYTFLANELIIKSRKNVRNIKA